MGKNEFKRLLTDLREFGSETKLAFVQKHIARVESAAQLGLCSERYYQGFVLGIRARFNKAPFDSTFETWSSSGDKELGYCDGYRGVVDWGGDLIATVKAIRHWRGWSTEKLGFVLGRSKRSIESWERGVNKIPKYVLHSLILIYYNY